MSVEENKAIVRAWLAARNVHDVEAAVAHWIEDHGGSVPMTIED